MVFVSDSGMLRRAGLRLVASAQLPRTCIIIFSAGKLALPARTKCGAQRTAAETEWSHVDHAARPRE